MNSPQKQHEEKARQEMFLRIFLPGFLYALGVLIVMLLSGQVIGSVLMAQNAGSTAPPLLRSTMDDCNLGFFGACNDNTGEYVAGPEAILNTWIFSEAIPWWVSFFIAFTAGVAVLMLMLGGIFLLVSGDKDEMKQKGIKTIIWAISGLLIVLFAFVIVSIIENLPLPGSTAEQLIENTDSGGAARTRS